MHLLCMHIVELSIWVGRGWVQALCELRDVAQKSVKPLLHRVISERPPKILKIDGQGPPPILLLEF